MKRASYALDLKQLTAARASYDEDIGVDTEIDVSEDEDGPYIEGADAQVDALINRITDDLGVEPVHVSN